MNSHEVIQTLKKAGNPERAAISMGYFKTGEGGYSAGDVFVGIPLPEIRKIAKQYKELPLPEVITLLSSEIHEYRLCALIILVMQFEKGNEETKKKIYTLYLANTTHINNWDLVDSSASQIVGTYLLDKDSSILGKLAVSKSLWEKRIAIIATYAFIKNNQYQKTMEIAEILLHDPHDLIHKAVGWMLREAGKRDQQIEEEFLRKHYKTMPRTMLRYAIEKFPEPLRKKYLAGTV